jgi:hypothetical protein
LICVGAPRPQGSTDHQTRAPDAPKGRRGCRLMVGAECGRRSDVVGVVGESAADCRVVGRQAAGVVWCRWSLRRLWVAVMSRHSERQADLPRRWKWSACRLYLVWANTGSTVTWRFRLSALLSMVWSTLRMNASGPPCHPCRAPALAGVGRDQDRDALGDDRLHLGLVPVAGIGDHHLGLVGDAGGRALCGRRRPSARGARSPASRC